MTKVCTRCKKEQPLDEFYEHKNHATKSGTYLYCKTCAKKDNQANYRRNKNSSQRQETARRSHLKRFYGITLEQYDELLEKQNHSCAICEKHQDDLRQRMAVDHNHSTGEIRGLLCTYCNHRLIGKHKDGSLLRKMADYVDQGTGLFVPENMKTGRRKRRKRK